MRANDFVMQKIDYPTLLLFHIDRILKRINDDGVTQTVETSIDALWASITDEMKREKMGEWESISSWEITGRTEYEKMEQGKKRTLAKLQLIMNILGENGILYRSMYEEAVGEEVKIIED